MLSKVLIANRGEIAARIIKTCRRLGIRTVAIFSDADKDATHLVKPDEGGGGKGTRKVNDLTSAAEGLEAASREAKLYFGNGAVYAEKLLERPRHVEVQVLADNHGNTVHLFERECSLQRR